MATNYMKQNYEFKEFTVEDFDENIRNGLVILPRFQRDLVWTNKQIEELAKSLKDGIPFGTFLLAGENPYKLLDGLQRANAIRNIFQKPQKFFNKDQVDDLVVSKIKLFLKDNDGKLPENVEDDIKEGIELWVRSQPNTDPVDKFTGFYLTEYLFSRYMIREENVNVYKRGGEILKPIIQSINREINNIGKIKIPCILYKGPDEFLPVIFEKLNSTGTKLSRFQIFAANWVNKSLSKVTDKDIKKAVYEEYVNRQSKGEFTIDQFPENEKDFLKQDLNLYEYLLGLGLLLEKDFKYLFFNKGDSIGFTLSAACLQGSIKNIINIEKIFNDEFKYEEYQKALFDSVETVFGALKPYIALRINKSGTSKDPKPIIFHSDYQIISFIAKVFRDKHDLESFNEKPEWNSIKTWVNQIPYHYLYDQLEDNWRGSGDKRIEDMLNSDRYHNPISKETWDNTLNKWFKEKELSKKQKSRTRVDTDDLLLLNYIYTHIFTNFDVQGTKEFHLEHLTPVKKLSGYIQKRNNQIEGLAISAVSNLCFLDASINKRKGKKTIYQFIKENPEDVNIFNVEEKCTFTSEEDLVFVDLLTGDNDEGWEDYYNEFLLKRFNVLKEKFFELNKIT